MARVAVVTGGTRGIGANRRDMPYEKIAAAAHNPLGKLILFGIVACRRATPRTWVRSITGDSQRHQRACTSADVFLRELA
jgi:hypothetical protein